MADPTEVEKARRKARMEQDWNPGYGPDSAPKVKHQMTPWSYTVYQLGQIHRKLDRLIGVVEKLAEKG